MGQRGRPRTPDILTPREWEVLELLRSGLSNRQIAARLGISYDGARYHVSEILSKLCLESREEAAVWRPEVQVKRRWSMLPHLPVLSSLREFAGLIGAHKLVMAGFPAVVLGLAAGGYGAVELVTDSTNATPPMTVLGVADDPCKRLLTRQCFPEDESQNFTSLEEAHAVASFAMGVPAFVPESFERVSIRHTRPEGTTNFVQSDDFKRGCPGCDPRMSHNDQIGLYYKDDSDNHLILLQGFPAYIPFYESTPEERRGTVQIGDRQAYWVRYEAGDDGWKNRLVVLYWDLGNVGTGWATLPDGGTQIGSPMSYSITSNSLSVEDLVRIAESIEFE